MNSENSLNKSSDAIFIELSQAVERLKQQAKVRFDKDKSNSDDEYERAYTQGYFFGQMASLEDCYNLFIPFLSKVSQGNKSANVTLKQQLMVTIKIIDDLTEKINSNNSVELYTYLDLIKNTIYLIKESSKKYMTDKPVEFLPDIFQYLEQLESTKAVTAKGLEEIIYRMHASTGISKEACTIIIKIYFQEIRSGILRGDKIVLAGLGKFFLSSPKSSKNKKRVFPKFKPYKTLIRKMNYE